MAVHRGWLLGGTLLAFSVGQIARAEEAVEPATNPTPAVQSASVQSTSAQYGVGRPRLFWFFGRPAYSSSTTTVTKISTPSSAPAAVAAPAARVARPQDTQQPALSPNASPVQPQTRAPTAATEFSASVFGSGSVPTSQLSQQRRSRASGAGSDVVSGRESGIRATTDAGSLLGKSSSARGISTQQRTPIMTDTRIRGSGVGRMVASGG